MFCLELFISVFLNWVIRKVIVLTVALLKTIRESDKIYHGCFNKYKDGTNKLIKKGEKCLTRTHFSFWKCPWDVPNGVITGTKNKKKKQKKTTVEKFNKYFQIFNGG